MTQIAEKSAKLATSAPAASLAPEMLSHLAMVTHDAEATTDFYTRIMRMPLVAAVMHERIPSTREIMPYLHLFFRMQDGSTIAFFEGNGLPVREAPPHPMYDIFNHVALEVSTVEQVDEWKAWVESNGIDVLGPVDHTIIYSIYFFDPNGIRLEITTPLTPDWNDRPDEAHEVVSAWLRTKHEALSSGADVKDALYRLVVGEEQARSK